MSEVIEVAGHWVVWSAAVVTAVGVLWRYLIRPVWRRGRAASDIITRELTADGGDSMKDMLGTIHDDIAALSERQQQEFSEIREQLADHGRKLDDHAWRIARMERGEVRP